MFSTLLFEDGEACLLEDIVAVAVGSGMAGEGIPFVKAVAQAKLLDNLVREASVMEVAESYGTSRLIVIEKRSEILLGEVRHMEESVALRLSFLLLVGQLHLLNLNAITLGQPTQCLGVGVALVLH